MLIEFDTKGFDAGSELHQLARCCAGYELGTFRKQVARVRIRVAAVPESRGGRDISCAVQVDFHDRDGIFTESVDSNPYVAIHWALERAGWTIAQQQKDEPLDQRLSDMLPLPDRETDRRDEAGWTA